MDPHSRRPDDAPPDPNAPHSAEARRRQLLRRSLGLAAPVALTLASTPVSAGRCLSASAFVSVNTHLSHKPLNMESCSGYSPSEWASNRFWPGSVNPTDKFHACLGAQVLDPKVFFKGTSQNNGQPSLQQVLEVPSSIEAHVAAAWLNALRYPGQPQPFGSAQAVKDVWTNIVAHGGWYSPGNGRPDITPGGTRLWLAQAWQS